MGNILSGSTSPTVSAEEEDPSMGMSLPFYDNNQIMSKLSPNAEDYVFLGVGSFGCAFRGYFDGRPNCIIKFNRYYDKKGELARGHTKLKEAALEVYETSVREANVGNFLNKQTLESSSEHWAQTLAFGFYIGPMPAFAQSAKVKAPQCAADFDKPYTLHYIIVQEQAGKVDLSSWSSAKRVMSTDHICKIAFQCCWALFTAGASLGFVHCDLKPDNMVVDEVVDASKRVSYSIKGVASFSVKYDVGDPFVRLIDYGLGFMSGSPGEERPTSAFWYPSGGTPIFNPIEYYTADSSADITSARDMFSIGIMLVCLKAQNVLSLGRGPKYNYQAMRQPPVSGRTSSGKGPEASEFEPDAFTFGNQSQKHKICIGVWGTELNGGMAEHQERARHVAQTLLLLRALEVDLTTDATLQPFVAAFLPPERTAYEMNVRALFKETQLDLLLLDFIQRLLAVKASDRLSFGLPWQKDDGHAFNNALFHALFLDSGFVSGNAGGGGEAANVEMEFKYGSRMPLPFHKDKDKDIWFELMENKDDIFLKRIPAYRDPKDVVAPPVIVPEPQAPNNKENAPIADSALVKELTVIFFKPNVETGFDPNVKKTILARHQNDVAQSQKNEAVLKRAYAEVTRTRATTGGILSGYLNKEGKRLNNWRPELLTRVTDQKKKKRDPEDPSNQLTSLVAGTLLHLAARKDAGPYLKEAQTSPYGAFNDKIRPIIGPDVDLAPYQQRVLDEVKWRESAPIRLSLPEVCSILERIEHCAEYTDKESKSFVFDAISADLLPPIEEGLNRHAATIKNDPALCNAFRPLVEGNGALVFPNNVPGQIRYFHWLSVVVDMLHSIDTGKGVDAFSFQRCQSEMPPSFIAPPPAKGRVQHV